MPAVVRELWRYETLLPARYVQRGIFSLGDSARMRRFTHKLLSGEAACHVDAPLPLRMCGSGALGICGGVPSPCMASFQMDRKPSPSVQASLFL